MIAFPISRWSIIAAAYLVGGVLAILTRSKSVVTFDRAAGTATLERTRPVTRTARHVVAMAGIKTIEVEPLATTRGKTFRIRLVLEEGDALPFSEYGSLDVEALDSIAQEVFRWLNAMPGYAVS